MPPIVIAAGIAAGAGVASSAMAAKSAGKARKAAESEAQRRARIEAEERAKRDAALMPVRDLMLKKYIEGNEGFDPAMLEALISKTVDEAGADDREISGAIRTALLRRGMGGGDLPVGGDYVREIGGMLAQRSGQKAGALRDVRLANLKAALENRFNASNVLNGVAAQFNPADEAALSQRANEVNLDLQSQPGIMGAIGGSLLGGGTNMLLDRLLKRNSLPQMIGGQRHTPTASPNPAPPFDWQNFPR